MEIPTFWLKNGPAKFQKVMDQVLAILDFSKCYINHGIIVFNSTMKEHSYHPQDVFGSVGLHDLKLRPSECRFFQPQAEYFGHMIYLGGSGVKKAKVHGCNSKVPLFQNQLILVG